MPLLKLHRSQNLLLREKTGLLMQMAANRRYICIQNVILGNGQVASHTRLAAHKSGCLLQMNFALHLNKCNLEGFGSCDDFPEKQISSHFYMFVRLVTLPSGNLNFG